MSASLPVAAEATPLCRGAEASNTRSTFEAKKEERVTNPKTSGGHTLHGRCYCGAVQYVVADEFAYAAYCHCSNCRRTTRSAFKPFAGIERDKLVVTDGGENLLIFGGENANNTHCKVCGSLLFSVAREGAFVHVAMRTLTEDPTIRPTHHIFVGSKAPWHMITDGLPQYEQHATAAPSSGPE
jgi:hypothetical protein